MSGSSISRKIVIKTGVSDDILSLPPYADNYSYDGFSLTACEALLNAHYEKYNIDPQSKGAFEKLLDCEYKLALEINSEIEKSAFEECYQRYLEAQSRFLNDIRGRVENPDTSRDNSILLAPSSANLDHNVDASGVSHLITAVIKQFGSDELAAKVNSGPPEADKKLYWDNVSNPIELAASIIRIGTSTEYRKIRLRATTEVREWIKKTLDEASYDTQECLGSAPAVCSSLAKVLAFNPTMVMQGSMSEKLRGRLPSDLKIFDGSEKLITAGQIHTADVNNNHFPVFFNNGGISVDKNISVFKVAGMDFDVNDTKHADLIITGSNGTSWQAFGSTTDTALDTLVAANTIAIMSCFQNLSDDKTSSDFIATINKIHDKGTAVALLYSKSKFPDSEAAVFQKIRETGCIDYIGMNSDETPYLLHHIAQDAEGANLLASSETLGSYAKKLSADALHPDSHWDVVKETPGWILKTGLCLKRALDIPIVRVRGRTSDIIICSKDLEGDPEQLADNLIISRHLAVLKVGHYPQLFEKTEDLTMLKNPPCGKAFAAYIALADELKVMFNLSNEERQNFIRTGYLDTKSCRIISAPIPPMIAYKGRTVSAGDIMDSSFCMLSRDFLNAASRSNT